MNLPECFHVQAAAFNDAFERADGNGFAAVHGYDCLPSIDMTPLLMATLLAHERKTVFTENADDIVSVANWKFAAQGRATSRSFAPLENSTGEGSNQSARASFALAMASFSVSPALAHPGNSGNTADQRLLSGSNSMTRRSFMLTA